MDMNRLFPSSPLPKSKLTVDELVKMSESSFFRVGIDQRSKNLGSIKYIGFRYTFHKRKGSKGGLVPFVNLFFYMKGANFDYKKNKKGKTVKGKRKPRETYLLVAKFPLRLDIKNMKRLYGVPLQLFSSDPSFKFYFAYALNELDAVVTDDVNLVDWLGESLTDKPNIRNPDMKKQLTKHFYKFFKFISNVRPKEYMDKKYLLSSDVKIVNERIG